MCATNEWMKEGIILIIKKSNENKKTGNEKSSLCAQRMNEWMYDK